MLVVAVLTAVVTARPDSAGIVELVKGFAYGSYFLFHHCAILSTDIFTDN